MKRCDEEESASRGSLQRLTSMGRDFHAAPVSVFPYFVVWLFAALAGVFVKSKILSYITVGRALGRIEIPEMTRHDPSRSYLFSFLERL
jgi:hypothetical protein